MESKDTSSVLIKSNFKYPKLNKRPFSTFLLRLFYLYNEQRIRIRKFNIQKIEKKSCFKWTTRKINILVSLATCKFSNKISCFPLCSYNIDYSNWAMVPFPTEVTWNYFLYLNFDELSLRIYFVFFNFIISPYSSGNHPDIIRY